MNINAFRNSSLLIVLVILPFYVFSQSTFTEQDIRFESQGITLAGSVLLPDNPIAAVVIVHGSDPVKRELEFAKRIARERIAVLTYDKRGVGESGGTYVGPSVGTNNIDTTNLKLLAHDASAAVHVLQTYLTDNHLPIGLLGFSQAGWIIPLSANQTKQVDFMVLFSCPTITTLEQLRFQFYTNGNTRFWDDHTQVEARQHTENDPDRYQFAATDPKQSLLNLSIPGLWLYGEKDIQIPVKMCIEQLNDLKAQGKPFEYTLFPSLGHTTAFAQDSTPFEISIEWIKKESLKLNAAQKK